MTDLALLALLVAHAGPLRLDALAAEPSLSRSTWGARALIEYPTTGILRSFAAISSASYGRAELDVTLRAGFALDLGPRLEFGWQGTDLEVGDSDGGARGWACASLSIPMF